MFQRLALTLALTLAVGSAFHPGVPRSVHQTRVAPLAGFSDDYGWGQDVVRRSERAARAAEAGDIVVEVPKPLGVILAEDAEGNVYVDEVDPAGNGARAGLKKGLEVSMVSATFGSEMWNARGAGLGRVTKAIKVRMGPSVSLVVRDEKQAKANAKRIQAEAKRTRDVEEDKKKRKAMVAEINSERKEAAKKWFGLF